MAGRSADAAHETDDAASGGGAGMKDEGGAAGSGTAAAGAAGDGGGAGEAGAMGTPIGPGKNTCVFPAASALPRAALAPGFCAWVWATGAVQARGLKVDTKGNALVVATSTGSIISLWDDDHDGVSGASEQRVIATLKGLTHGIEVHGGYLYASTQTDVYRWRYAADRAVLGTPQVVVSALPSTGHMTRTLVADDQYLYVSVGSGANIDADSSRARIVRFALSSLSGAASTFASGELFADGLRNNVGMELDTRGRLWGVDNGRDDLSRADLGGDIHQDNPAEELNLFTKAGGYYGFPFCWTQYDLPGAPSTPRGTQWADPAFIGDGVHTDAWCRNPSHVSPPIASLPAHAAPLDLLFYSGPSFPTSFKNGVFIASHGSWDRAEPIGYELLFLPLNQNDEPNGEATMILGYDMAAHSPTLWPYRPVSMATLPNGVLLLSNDVGSSMILAVGYAP